MNIERERFEGWLFQQNPQDSYNFTSCLSCLMSRFIRSETGMEVVSGITSSDLYSVPWGAMGEKIESVKWPDWILNLRLGNYYTFGEVQARYIKLYGDPRKIVPAEPEPVRELEPA